MPLNILKKREHSAGQRTLPQFKRCSLRFVYNLDHSYNPLTRYLYLQSQRPRTLWPNLEMLDASRRKTEKRFQWFLVICNVFDVRVKNIYFFRKLKNSET